VTPVELHYTLTPAMTRLRVAEALAHEARKDAALLDAVTRGQPGALKLLLLLPFPVTSAYLLLQRDATPTTMVTAVVLALLTLPLWRLADRLLAPLHRRIEMRAGRHAGRLGALSLRLAEVTLRTRIASLEGNYVLRFDDHGFRLGRDPQHPVALAWTGIVHAAETEHFHRIACAALHRRGKAYWIPKRSEAMEPAAFQQGLQLFLERIPAAAFSEKTDSAAARSAS